MNLNFVFSIWKKKNYFDSGERLFANFWCFYYLNLFFDFVINFIKIKILNIQS